MKKLRVPQHLMIVLMTMVLVFVISGCVSPYLTTKFIAVEEIPEDKALVYIYRNNNHFGRYKHYTVNVNEEKVSELHLYRKGYLTYFADPGENVFWATFADNDTEVFIDIEKGKTYYIKGKMKISWVVGKPRLKLVDNDKGSKKIKKCKLIAD